MITSIWSNAIAFVPTFTRNHGGCQMLRLDAVREGYGGMQVQLSSDTDDA